MRFCTWLHQYGKLGLAETQGYIIRGYHSTAKPLEKARKEAVGRAYRITRNNTMRYLLNSAVIAAGAYGTYSYAPASVEELIAFVREPHVSRIGYADTCALVQALTGIRPELSRESSVMHAGDEAMVIRLRYRIADASSKGDPVRFDPADWEIAKLRRLDEDADA